MNEAANVHRASQFAGLLERFRQPGDNLLDATATEILLSIGLENQSVAHLCCNNGRELLSIKYLGAGRCVGFDFSEAFLEQARELCATAQLDCEFIKSDAFEIPEGYHNQFDIVVITIGTLCWMPELGEFFEIIEKLLKPQGRLFVYEMHPVLEMFENDITEDPLQIRYSYFKSTPWVETDVLDYYEKTSYQGSTQYCFHHKLCDIFTAIVDTGLKIEHFREYDHDISLVFSHFDEIELKPPLCYTLVGVKEI